MRCGRKPRTSHNSTNKSLYLDLNTTMPSFSLNTSSSDEYDAGGCDSSKRSKANASVESSKASAKSLARTPKRDQLHTPRKKTQRKNEVEDNSEQKRTSLKSSRMKLRSSSKNKREEDVDSSRSRIVSFAHSKFAPHKSPNVKYNRRTSAASKPLLDTPVAPYPPQSLKPPPTCPVGAIQQTLSLRLFDGELDSNQPKTTLTNFKEPLSYAQSPPISPGNALMGKDHSVELPGIVLLNKEQSAEDEDIANEQVKNFSPTPFTSMRPLLVVELDSPHKTEASYTSRKQLFSGETGSLDPRVEDPNEDEDKAVADERGEAYNMSPNLTQLSDELSRVNFKSTAAQYKAPGTNESYESALDDGVITRKMEILLDLSYLRAGVKLPKFAITNDHRKRIMLILDNSTRAKLVIAMILRNNKDIELVDLMREFDYFSS